MVLGRHRLERERQRAQTYLRTMEGTCPGRVRVYPFVEGIPAKR